MNLTARARAILRYACRRSWGPVVPALASGQLQGLFVDDVLELAPELFHVHQAGLPLGGFISWVSVSLSPGPSILLVRVLLVRVLLVLALGPAVQVGLVSDFQDLLVLCVGRARLGRRRGGPELQVVGGLGQGLAEDGLDVLDGQLGYYEVQAGAGVVDDGQLDREGRSALGPLAELFLGLDYVHWADLFLSEFIRVSRRATLLFLRSWYGCPRLGSGRLPGGRGSPESEISGFDFDHAAIRVVPDYALDVGLGQVIPDALEVPGVFLHEG